jgi:hypothetical protein
MALAANLQPCLTFGLVIHVVTTVYRDPTPTRDTTPSWRVQLCSIELGRDTPPIAIASTWVYASADAAHDDMKQQALEALRNSGYVVSEADVVWQLRVIE